jgi:peptidoglycan/LPS O-acetylase OafA/YrhL
VRKEIPMLITSVAGLFVIVSQYFQFAQNLHWLSAMNQWYQIAITIAFPVGLISLAMVHIGNIRRRRQRWVFSVVLLIAVTVYLIVSLITGPAHGKAMDWVYQGFISPASATLYGMIAFIITSCTFRVFRFRSREATILIIGALIVLLAQAPLGDAIWSGWGHFGTWLENVPGTAAFRAIVLGAYLGAFATAIRIILGIERAHIGGFAK